MSTNRTKIDWAYKAAHKIALRCVTANESQKLTVLREIAAILRRAQTRDKVRADRKKKQALKYKSPLVTGTHFKYHDIYADIVNDMRRL